MHFITIILYEKIKYINEVHHINIIIFFLFITRYVYIYWSFFVIFSKISTKTTGKFLINNQTDGKIELLLKFHTLSDLFYCSESIFPNKMTKKF